MPNPMSETDSGAVEAMGEPGPWKRGYPPGKYYEGMLSDFEVYLSPIGWVWHRRRPAAATLRSHP